jgi:hypothetical protein
MPRVDEILPGYPAHFARPAFSAWAYRDLIVESHLTRIKEVINHGQHQVIAQLLSSLHDNQFALSAAVDELSNWVQQRGSVEVAENVRGALDTLEQNLTFITDMTALLKK